MTAAQAKVSVPGWALQGVVGYARAGAPGLVAGVGWLGTFQATLTQGPRTLRWSAHRSPRLQPTRQ